MADSDSFTGKTPAQTYTKIVQIADDNELLDGLGGAVSPVIGGDLNVSGRIFQNGTELGGGDTALWTQGNNGALTRTSNVGIGISEIPEAKLEVNSTSSTEDFFIVKKSTETSPGVFSTQDVFKIDNEGTMVLGGKSTAPTATEGAIYYDTTEKEFYLGKG